MFHKKAPQAYEDKFSFDLAKCKTLREAVEAVQDAEFPCPSYGFPSLEAFASHIDRTLPVTISPRWELSCKGKLNLSLVCVQEQVGRVLYHVEPGPQDALFVNTRTIMPMWTSLKARLHELGISNVLYQEKMFDDREDSWQ